MYYDIDDIEADGQHVPALLKTTLPSLSSQGGADSTPMEEGSTLALPLWLAVSLASTGIGEAFAQLQTPDAFSADVLNALRSDPLAVSLYDQCPVFTQMALEWVSLFDVDEMRLVLYETVQTRFAQIYDNAMALKGPMLGFDESERRLYKLLHGVRKDSKAFLQRS